MSDFFDKAREQAYKVKDEAAKFTKQVVEKTSNAVSVTKFQFSANEIKEKIKEAYAEIGALVYKKYKKDGEVYELASECCEKIDKLMEELDIIKGKIAELKENIKCPGCGEFNKKGAVYCSKCGTNLKDIKEDIDDIIDEGVDGLADVGDEVRKAAVEFTQKASDFSAKAADFVEEAIEDTEKFVEDTTAEIKKRIVTIKARKPEKYSSKDEENSKCEEPSQSKED